MAQWPSSGHHEYGRIIDQAFSSDVELSVLLPTVSKPQESSEYDDTTVLLHSGSKLFRELPRLSDKPPQSRNRRFHLRISPSHYDRLEQPIQPDKSPRGWRTPILVATALASVILVINSVFAIVAEFRFKAPKGVGVIYEGNCTWVSYTDTGLHVLINLLSSTLLCASSYTMQCLSSPTRRECDRAHVQRVSLRIGLSSFTNLLHMKPWKGVLWVLLCSSTLPLHLLWNSTIYSTSSINWFSWIAVDSAFLEGAPYQIPLTDDSLQMIETIYNGYQAKTYVNLSAYDCFDSYVNVDIVEDRRNLILVVERANDSIAMGSGYSLISSDYVQYWNGSSVYAVGIDLDVESNYTLPAALLFFQGNISIDIDGTEQRISKDKVWKIGNFTVQSCWSEVVNVQKCELQYVSYMLYAVIICNCIKIAGMICAAKCLWNQHEPILATVGDAASSFMEVQDSTTEGWALLDYQTLKNWKTSTRSKQDMCYNRLHISRLYFATSRKRWWSTMGLCTFFTILGFTLFGLSFQLTPYSLTFIMTRPFGMVDSDLTLGLEGDSAAQLMIDAVVANSFQLLLSATYLLYNSLYSAQYAALEWSAYVKTRTPLRVTKPRGFQVSSYYLQLPYVYSIPLMVSLSAMHFLVSESVFLALIKYYDSRGQEVVYNGFSDVGFSPRATLTTCCLGVVLVLAQLLHSYRLVDNRIPMHGNQSAVISALCHLEKTDDHNTQRAEVSCNEQLSTAQLPLIWGVTRESNRNVRQSIVQNESEMLDARAGHCTFSPGEVLIPEMGEQYQ